MKNYPKSGPNLVFKKKFLDEISKDIILESNFGLKFFVSKFNSSIVQKLVQIWSSRHLIKKLKFLD